MSIAEPGGVSPPLGPRVHLRRRRRARVWLAAAGTLLCAGAVLCLWWSRAQHAAAPAADDPFTLYVLGSSTALGYPYFPQANVGKIARLCLDGRLQDRPIRVVNLAGPGKTARVTLRDVQELVGHPPPAGRSAAFVYVGNNEFLTFDRRHDLRRAERTLFDTPAVTFEERERVVARYEEQLEKILVTLRDAGIPPYVSTVAVNLKHWEPNRSVLRDERHAPVVQACFDRAAVAQTASDRQAALRAYEDVLAIEPHFALAAFRAGECALQLGRRAAARRYFQSAADADGNPLRDTTDMSHAVQRVAMRTGVSLLDGAQILNAASPDSILGDELLWDNCHPNLEGYTQLAAAWAAMLCEAFPCTVRVPAQEAVRAALGIDTAVEQEALHREGQYAYGASTLVFDPAPRLARARRLLERADAIGPSAEVKCSIAVLEALAGDVPASLAAWRRAQALDPGIARRRISNRTVQQIMTARGIPDPAATLD